MCLLSGQRIVVTRAAHQADELARPLRELCAQVISLPMIAIGPPLDPAPLLEAVREMETYDWLIFTSANSVRAFPKVPRTGIQVAAVGPATKAAAVAAGFNVAAMPDTFEATAIAPLLGTASRNNRHILIPTSDLSRDTLPAELQRLGFEVTVVEAYRNRCPPEAAAQASAIFRQPFPDWVLFASPSAVHNLVSLVGAAPLTHSHLASIGSLTSQAIRSAGLPVTVQADPQTVPGLVLAISTFAQRLHSADAP